MWVLRLRIRHNCVIGNRCKKYKCWSYSIPLSNWNEGEYNLTSHIHTIEGPAIKVKKFIANLKLDPEIVHYENFGQTVFLVQRRKTKDVGTAHYNSKLFLLKPVYTSSDGIEYAEFCSWSKRILMEYLVSLENTPQMGVKVEKFHKTKLGDVYFPNLYPRLSGKQREAFQLAIKERYYGYPRKAELQHLAKLMSVSVSTFQEHLRKAERKLFQIQP